MFYYTEILLCLFALLVLRLTFKITIILSIQRSHAIESRPNWMSVEMWVHSILLAASPVTVHREARRVSSCTCDNLKIWQEQKVRRWGPWPVLIYAFHPPCRCCRKSSINPWAFHFPTQLRVTEHKTNGKAVRREEERQTIDRKKDFTLWHGSNHCPQGNALQAEHAVNALKKKTKKVCPRYEICQVKAANWI